MEVKKLNCEACGAPISVPDDVDHLNCQSCGSYLVVKRGEGYTALKMVEKVAQAIENSGKGTQDAIRDQTYVTQAELKKLQISQQISGVEMQINSILAEIRSLERSEMSAKIIHQLQQLILQYYQLLERRKDLQIDSNCSGM
jgi:DNA-directed RNA polymerase subunit RPC12/RpoP